jgi:hypothetical protein
MENEFLVSYVENIDDKEYGINPLQNGYSLGYLTFDKIQVAMKYFQGMTKIFRTLNAFQEKYNLKISLNIEQK